MMDQMTSELNGVVIKFNTTQPRIVYNAIKIRIIPELLTEDGHFLALFMIFLALQYAGK